MIFLMSSRCLFEGGVYSRAAFHDIFVCPRGVNLRASFHYIFACPRGVYLRAAFVRGQRLFEGGVYSNSYGKGVILFLL